MELTVTLSNTIAVIVSVDTQLMFSFSCTMELPVLEGSVKDTSGSLTAKSQFKRQAQNFGKYSYIVILKQKLDYKLIIY